MSEASVAPVSAHHPIRLRVTDDLRRTRLTAFFRPLLAIPHFLWLALLGVVVLLCAIGNWFATLWAARSTAGLHGGMTAHYLATSTYPVQQGDNVLLHAAAGGVGLMLTQIVKLRGGRVIATTSSDDKAELARHAGADEVIGYEGFAERVRELSGEGVAVVYDGVGKATFDESLASLRPRGMLVLYGAASGPVPPVEPMRLENAGSLFLTRPSLRHYTARREELLERAGDVFGWIAAGTLEVRIGGRYPLEEARQAHEDLESRRTTGKLVLLTR